MLTCLFSVSAKKPKTYLLMPFSFELEIHLTNNRSMSLSALNKKKNFVSIMKIICTCACLCLCRRDVLDELVTLHNFSNQFLPNALRDFFRHIHAPEERGEYLETLITKFSHRFCTCNPGLVRELGLSPG